MATINATGTPQLTTNGQVIIGSTGAPPVAATLTQGTGITITNGAGSVTIASSGGISALTLLSTATAAASATINFDNFLTSTYDNYLIMVDDVVVASGGGYLSLRVGTGATPTYQTTTYVLNSTITTSIQCSGIIGTVAQAGNASTGATITLFNANSTTHFKPVTSAYLNLSAAGAVLSGVSGSMWTGATTALSSVQLFSNVGNLTTGTFRLYGVKN